MARRARRIAVWISLRRLEQRWLRPITARLSWRGIFSLPAAASWSITAGRFSRWIFTLARSGAGGGGWEGSAGKKGRRAGAVGGHGKSDGSASPLGRATGQRKDRSD